MRLLSGVWLGVLAACASLAVFGSVHAAVAGEATFQVQLVWGSDGERPKDKPIKDVDPKLQDKLKGVFKWKSYYEVNRQALSVPKDGSQKLKLSEKCEIQVQDLGASRIEIRLFGEGKLVVKKAQTIIPGEMIVLAGDSKDDTAWFVVVTPPK